MIIKPMAAPIQAMDDVISGASGLQKTKALTPEKIIAARNKTRATARLINLSKQVNAASPDEIAVIAVNDRDVMVKAGDVGIRTVIRTVIRTASRIKIQRVRNSRLARVRAVAASEAAETRIRTVSKNQQL